MPELPDALKSSHAEVQYGGGNMRERCGLCVHFIPETRCESVASPVSRGGWCMRFERDREAKAA